MFYGHYRSIFNHCDIVGLKICRIRWEKRKIRATKPFKVNTQTHTRTDYFTESVTDRYGEFLISDILGRKSVEFGEKKTQNKGYGVQGHSRSSRSVPIESSYAINSNWHPISYRFGVIAAYCSDFGHFAFLTPLAFCLKLHFAWRKSATKFLCVKTVSL